KNYLFTLFLILLAFVAILFWTEYQKSSEKLLTVYVLDVGQGDAILIESPTGTQVLVDTGPPGKILGQLAKVMSPTDRSLDILFITHPDQDHIGGAVDVLKNYSVNYVFESGVLVNNQTFNSFHEEIKNQNIQNFLARKGTQLDLGDGVYIDILFPDRNVFTWKTNDSSIVMRLTYGENSIMLTGDANFDSEKIILSENSAESLQSDILKVGHHGSKTSTSSNFLKAVDPDYAVISVGLNNKYDHPKQEILSLLTNFGVDIFRTDELGQIEIKCDKIEPCKIN
ncbi:MAG: MBL fold metallo-hydrolase, partial [Patescibacteria group bacterium]